MASSSSAVNIFHVFTSFHGPDVRRGFLSHLQYYFETKGIKMFKDQKIDRGYSIKPELFKAIGESRVCLVLLSKNYASSGWCLDELAEIMRCRETSGKIVMTIFYEGDFGSTFMKTCQGKDEEVKERWSKALTDVANIEGEHSDNWPTEAEMIQQIAIDVSNKLNLTPSRDFDGMVGLEAHLTSLKSLLCLECDDVKMIGIWGPAGIGKTTIARALYEQPSSSFSFKCFMEDLKGIYKSNGNYDSKLGLQRLLLSRILNDSDIKVHHLGAIKHWLHNQRVLIILDDVDDLEILDVLAKELSWFGPGSRIIVTTEDRQILRAHGIDDIYSVDFPSEEEAREILCLSAFKGASVRDGFEELVDKVAGFCSNLPLGLAVVGSSLRGESKTDWERQLSKIETGLDRKIEDVLRVGYDRLSKKDQALFLHIACFFFFHEDVDRLTTMLAHSNLNVGNGLKTLEEKSMVHRSFYREIVMHSLLQNLGRQIVVEQSEEPGKRQFLIEPKDISNVLANNTGTESLIGIKFDMSNMEKFSISEGAFEGMSSLQFLQIYSQLGQQNENVSCLRIQEDLKYLPRLRLLNWDFYPGKRLPPTFQPERLVELGLQFSNLEKLWDGIQPLANLKKMDLNFSYRLKEIPNLSKATNLETLLLSSCSSLVELPSSIKNLHKLKKLKMKSCKKLRLIPTNINLISLKGVDMDYCSQLETFPDISRNIKTLSARDTKIKDVPASVVGRWSRCRKLEISLERLTHVPQGVTKLDLINSAIKRIPECITGLSHLVDLIVENCTNLGSIPALPPSLKSLNANSCMQEEESYNNRFRSIYAYQYRCFSLYRKTRVTEPLNGLKKLVVDRISLVSKSLGSVCVIHLKVNRALYLWKIFGDGLSEFWRVPVFDLDSLQFDGDVFGFIEFVDKFLKSYENLALNRFKLIYHYEDIGDDDRFLESWIDALVRRRVRHLDFQVNSDENELVWMPLSLYSCNTFGQLKPLPRSLELLGTRVNCFPALSQGYAFRQSKLTVIRDSFELLEIICVRSKSLKSFALVAEDSEVGLLEDHIVEIDAPKLERMSLCDHLSGSIVIYSIAPSAVEWPIKFSYVPSCFVSSLKYVELSTPVTTRTSGQMKLAIYFMRNCAALKKLTLSESFGDDIIKKIKKIPRRSRRCSIVTG
ncbi:BnaA04g11170D [Brassica napus]|uniref:BnaA04g11170D protein n=1 Tax=Brassica napus TaxID=3708 RepID=A0A078HQ40_BRANA|nr:BnaA04g11170D [Brassica napus]